LRAAAAFAPAFTALLDQNADAADFANAVLVCTLTH